jgi:hypothetical protein
MTKYLKTPAKFGIGLSALLIMLIPAAINFILMYIGNTYYPCNDGSANLEQGLFGCNNTKGDIFTFFRALAQWSFIFISPVGLFIAVVAFLKNNGRKLATAAAVLGVIYLAIHFIFFA